MSRRVATVVVLLAAGLLCGAAPPAGPTPEERTERYLESVRATPPLLIEFLRRMPKAGDLHNHLSGAVYAETYVDLAAAAGLCVDRATAQLTPPPCDPAKSQVGAAGAREEPALYRRMIDAFSMRNFQPGAESGHDHFFATFGRFWAAGAGRTGDMLAEVVARAAAERVSYLELMLSLDRGEAGRLAAQVGGNDDLARLREKFLAGGLADIVAAGRRRLDEAEQTMRERLRCGTPQADAGCGVVVRYLYSAGRAHPPAQVFAELLTAFETARTDPRVLGINLLMPEDDYVARRDFDVHMRMLDYLHALHPRVRVSLHAGELWPGLVPPEALRFHIRASIERGHAERIGHGVSVMHEDDALGLVREMARRGILVEICLTSNDVILGVRGAEHPLPVYLRYGVPVALATDDAGVSRSDMTGEFRRAVETYRLRYRDLRTLVRASLRWSFLPGPSLWAPGRGFHPVAACAADRLGGGPPSPRCRRFLEESERARLEWKLEAELRRFEAQF